MSIKSKPNKEKEKLERAERLSQTINILEENVRQIIELGKLAPDGCYVSRYQARGQKKAYWYYKLHASSPIFPKVNSPTELSRYLHLGAAGSADHVNAVLQVVRRVQVNELQKAIHSLKESWSDLYSASEEKKKKREE